MIPQVLCMSHEAESTHSNTMTHKLFCRPITKEDIILQLSIDCWGETLQSPTKLPETLLENEYTRNSKGHA